MHFVLPIISITGNAHVCQAKSLTNRADRVRLTRVRKIAYNPVKSLIGPLANMITPGQIAESLQVSTATVRRWSARFASFLSPHTPGKKRSYTDSDLAILSRIRDMTKNGMTMDLIAEQLPLMDQPVDPSTALITLTDFARSLHSALDQVAIMTVKMDKQTAWINQVNAWFDLPWYKRLFTKPPKSE